MCPHTTHRIHFTAVQYGSFVSFTVVVQSRTVQHRACNKILTVPRLHNPLLYAHSAFFFTITFPAACRGVGCYLYLLYSTRSFLKEFANPKF